MWNKKKIKLSEIQENISEEADELLGTTPKQTNKNTQTNKTHLNSALSSKISCIIMCQCSNWSAYNHTVFSKSTQANTQRHRLKPSLIERNSTDLGALLGCSGHINNGFQPQCAGDMLKWLWDSLYSSASWPPNAHSSIHASHSHL